MGEILPEVVRRRRDKADFSHVFARALIAGRGTGFPDRLRAEERGWLRGGAVRAMLERMAAGFRGGDPAYGEQIGPLWTVFALECWLAAIEGDAAVAPDLRAVAPQPA